MRSSPLAISLCALCLGVAASLLLLVPGIPPFFGKDLDGDGVSDNIQRVHEEVEYTAGPDGGWSSHVIGYGSEPDLPLISFALVGLDLALPVSAYIIVWKRREDARRSSERSEGMTMHDTVRRIAAFLEVNPSLISAIRYTYSSMPEHGTTSLGRLIWAMRAKGNDFEREYAAFRAEWAREDPLVAKALADLWAAEREPTPSEVSGSARRAMDELTEGARRRMSAYVHSLQGPSTALFGIGVLLPVLMAAMVPISGIGGGSSFYMLAFLLWVVIPGGIVLLGGRIVSRRPRYMADAPYAIEKAGWSFRIPDVMGLAAGAFLLAAGTADLAGAAWASIPWPGLDASEGRALTLMWGSALTAASLVRSRTWLAAESGRHLREVERSVPDLLQSIGASVSDGCSFEGALKRSIPEGPLEPYRPALLPIPGMRSGADPLPPQLENAYRASRQFARSGPESGGRAIRALGSHLRGLLSLEDEMSERVSDSVGQMEVTSAVFAPLMIGASVGIFRLLDPEVLSEGLTVMGGGAGTMSSSSFMVLSGTYLLLLSAASTVTISRLRSGKAGGGWERVPLNLVRSAASFTAGALIAIAVIG